MAAAIASSANNSTLWDGGADGVAGGCAVGWYAAADFAAFAMD